MLHTAAEVKEMLTKLIHHLKSTKSLYVKNPEKDFTRERKLSFEKVITCLLGMGGGSLANELMDQFGCCADLVTVSAFIQQRNKLLPSALETLFHLFVEKSECSSLYKGYRLLAVDGSALQIPTDKDDMDSFFPGASNKEPYNLLHLNAMYDLIAHTYTDAILQKGRVRDEIRALTDMVDRAVSTHPTILLADRGFESYNVFAHVQEKGWHYLIRVKDGGVNGGIGHGLDLPSQDEFDVPIHLLLTRSQSKENKKLLTNRNKYKHIHYSQNFDFLPQKVDSATPALFYELSFRLVRFRLPNGTYETVITNLDPESFPSIELKQLYALRWGIENSFRQLKHTVGLLHFHAKRRNLFSKKCLQDFSCTILPNLSQRLQLFIEMINDILIKQISPLQCTFVDYLFVVIHHQIQKFLLPNLLPLYGQGGPPLGFELLNLLLISHIEQPDLFLFYNFCRYLICFFVMPFGKSACIFS